MTDIKEIIHKLISDDNNLVHIYECSKCHKTVADDYINLHKYCLHCGNPKDVK